MKGTKQQKYPLAGFQRDIAPYQLSNPYLKNSLNDSPTKQHTKLREQRRKQTNDMIGPFSRDSLLNDLKPEELIQNVTATLIQQQQQQQQQQLLSSSVQQSTSTRLLSEPEVIETNNKKHNKIPSFSSTNILQNQFSPRAGSLNVTNTKFPKHQRAVTGSLTNLNSFQNTHNQNNHNNNMNNTSSNFGNNKSINQNNNNSTNLISIINNNNNTSSGSTQLLELCISARDITSGIQNRSVEKHSSVTSSYYGTAFPLTALAKNQQELKKQVLLPALRKLMRDVPNSKQQKQNQLQRSSTSLLSASLLNTPLSSPRLQPSIMSNQFSQSSLNGSVFGSKQGLNFNNNSGITQKEKLEVTQAHLVKAENEMRALSSQISATMTRLHDTVIERDQAQMLSKEVKKSEYANLIPESNRASPNLKQSNQKNHQASLNMKVLNERFYQSNTFDVPFLRHIHRASVGDPLEIASQIQETTKKGNSNRGLKPSKDEDELLQIENPVHLQSRHDFDEILGSRRVQEKQAIMAKVAHSLSISKRTHLHPSESYNKWYVEPKHRLKQKQDFSKASAYPFRDDDEYIYNHMHDTKAKKGQLLQKQKNPLENNKDNSSPVKVLENKVTRGIDDSDDEEEETEKKREYEKQIEHARNVIQHIDMIREFTDELENQGQRIPHFLKEVISHDIGRQQARQVFKNKYFDHEHH